MEIKFTKEQYENLIKIVYLGNWMVNAIRSGNKGDEQIEKYNKIEQYIFSFAKDFGLEKYIEYNENFREFFPTREFEEADDIEQYREDYNNETFWLELVDRLSRRDFIKEWGEDAIRKMDWKEQIEKEDPFIEKYEKEFEKNGIENLIISEKQQEE